MLYFTLLNFLTLCLLYSLCKANKYCTLTEKHTMCQYHGIGKRCINTTDHGVTSEIKYYILNTHNNFRRKVARGAERRGLNRGQPPAANMMKLEWDLELQTIAQRWADQCVYENDERRVQRWEVGQNLFFANSSESLPYWSVALGSWIKEVEFFDGDFVSNFEFDFYTARYSQMVWGNTYRIGCGMRSWGNNKIYVCNYGPAGNAPKSTMYEIGKLCTKCPSNTECIHSLCVYSESFLRADVIDTQSLEAGKSKP